MSFNQYFNNYKSELLNENVIISNITTTTINNLKSVIDYNNLFKYEPNHMDVSKLILNYYTIKLPNLEYSMPFMYIINPLELNEDESNGNNKLIFFKQSDYYGDWKKYAIKSYSDDDLIRYLNQNHIKIDNFITESKSIITRK